MKKIKDYNYHNLLYSTVLNNLGTYNFDIVPKIVKDKDRSNIIPFDVPSIDDLLRIKDKQ
jgi:hypothetical protein